MDQHEIHHERARGASDLGGLQGEIPLGIFLKQCLVCQEGGIPPIDLGREIWD